jgi:two-component system sensor histidine kinase UhpB
VTVALSLDTAGLRMRIADNGAGFDPAPASTGIGIVGMRERVAAFDGRIDIDTAIGAGTSIAISIPFGAGV